jgi:hypothetical protein
MYSSCQIWGSHGSDYDDCSFLDVLWYTQVYWWTYVLDESAASIIFPTVGGKRFQWNFFWTKHSHISEKSDLHVVFHCLTMRIPFSMYLSTAAVKDVLSHRKPSFTRNLLSIFSPAIHLTLFHSETFLWHIMVYLSWNSSNFSLNIIFHFMQIMWTVHTNPIYQCLPK